VAITPTRHEYRPDIDGLRAVAVLSVAAFHYFPTVVTGGFVGVDIFFVISGYLITGIILETLDGGTFGFAAFYARRIRRIFPALILVLCACAVFGRAALFENEFKQLSTHILAGAGFFSNTLLRLEAGYFDNSVQTKPLLHLWSLAIEEQFYLLWPFCLWLAYKKRFGGLIVILTIALTSFRFMMLQSGTSPAVAFYSLFTRCWELMIGSALAWASLYGKRFFPTSANLRDALSLNGALLLAFGVWRLDSQVGFPGPWAIVPVLGTVLVIAAGPEARINRLVLSNPIAVWVGLISFPLYLWHWPLLSFETIIEGETPSISFRVGALAMSMALAYLTYRFIEQPVRRKGHGRPKVAILVSLVAILGLFGLRNTLAESDDVARVKAFLADSKRNCDAYFPDWTAITDNPCHLQKKSGNEIALIGDSHAGQLFVGLSELEADKGVALFPASCAAPFIDVSTAQKNAEKLKVRKNAYSLINRAYDYVLNDKDIRVVILAHTPLCSFDDAIDLQNPQNRDYKSVLADGMRRTLLLLSKAGKKVIIVYDNPYLPFEPSLCLERRFRSAQGDKEDKCSFPQETSVFPAVLNAYRAITESVIKDFDNVKTVDLFRVLCDGSRCHPLKDGRLLYQDKGHLSDDGSRFVAPYIKALQ
jgi:peptidoglycan/LPS O-acetylase OafA/YrhL